MNGEETKQQPNAIIFLSLFKSPTVDLTMGDSSEDDVDDQLEAAVSRFPLTKCEEVDELFEGVGRGKTAITNFQSRKIVAEQKTILEMTLKTSAATTSPERTDEVLPFLERVANGQLDLKEFTIRNVLKGETYLRLELAPKEGVKKGKNKSKKKEQQQQQPAKKSKEEIQAMETELSFLQNKLQMMQNLADSAGTTVSPVSSVSTAASAVAAAESSADAAAAESAFLASTIEKFASRAREGVLAGRGGDGHVPYESTPEMQALEKKTEQIGSEIVELLKEAEALIANKKEEPVLELDVGDLRINVDDDDVVAAVAAAAAAAEDTASTDAAAAEVAADVASDVSIEVEAGVDAAVSVENLDAQMKAHVATLEQEASDMEANIMRLINTVNSMAKRVEEKKN